MARPAAIRHHPREEPGALARTPGSARGDRGNPVPYRDPVMTAARISQPQACPKGLGHGFGAAAVQCL